MPYMASLWSTSMLRSVVCLMLFLFFNDDTNDCDYVAFVSGDRSGSLFEIKSF